MPAAGYLEAGGDQPVCAFVPSGMLMALTWITSGLVAGCWKHPTPGGQDRLPGTLLGQLQSGSRA